MEKKLYDLTAPQKSIWLTEQFYKGTNINNVCGVFSSSVPLNFSLFEKAIKIFVQNNESFRTKLTLVDGEVKQYFDDYSNFNIKIINVASDKELSNLKKEINSKGFELLDSTLFSFTIFKYPDNRGGFIVNANHIISDSWTSGIIANEISKIYCLLKSGESFEKDSELSYLKYIKTEQEYINSEKFNKDKAYWDSIFETVPELATIPSLNQTSSSDTSFKAKRFYGDLSLNKLEKLREYSIKNKVSLYNLLMGIFALYLGRVSNLDNFVIGTPILNRTNFKEKQTTGMFINVLPLKFDINHEQKFNEFISKIAKDSMGLLRHQRYSYNYILEDLRKKDSSLPGLYNVLLSYQITKMNENNDELPHQTSWVFNESTANDLDIHIFEWNDNNSLQIAYDYRLDKYSEEEISMIHERILHVINQILNNENILLKEIEIVTKEEKNKILYEFNNTKSDYPKDKTISQLFEEQVEKTPDNIALVFEDQKLTYKELNEKANQLANYLIEKGVKPGEVIGIFLDKSLEIVISMLGILKANCTFLPLDIEYPKERISYIIDDAKVSYILSFNKLKKLLPSKCSNILINVSINNNSIYLNYNKSNINFKNISSENIIYIIYTSGSTGKPKGVLVKHKNISRLIINQNFIKFNSFEIMVQTGTIAFDACIFEIFGAILHGFKLYILKKDILLNIKNFEKFLNDKQISILFLTTGLFNEFGNLNPNMFKNLRYLLTGGDVISSTAVNNILSACPNIHLVNCYGPTENGSYSTCFNIPINWNQKYIPIGKPISNSTAYIVSRCGQLQPIGVPGELWVGGDGIAKGYINRDDLTKESFFNSPFNTDFIYKTGDLVKYDSLNNICFIGRIDSQIKLRGFRIELNEIDSSILNFDNIKESLSVIIKSNTTPYIYSYITSDSIININKLKTYLSINLPKYMLPTEIIQIDSFPLNINGKIDRKALPIPKENKYKNIIKSRNNIDDFLTQTLSSLLNINISKISIDDNFFELGGDSLNAINLSAKIYSKFNMEIFVKDILEYPIISDLSDLISSKISNTSSTFIKKVKKADYYNISSAQKNIYLASELGGKNSLIYNIAGGVILDNVPDVKKLENCFNTLIQRHESFRTYFETENENIVQKILDKIDFKLDVSKKSISENDLDISFKEFVKPFDLSKAPLMRSKLIKLDNKKAALFVDMHHIISDGTSLSIFIDELCKLYNNETLEEIKFTYKDFANFENEALSLNKFEEAEKYWVNQFENDIPVLNMPTNYSRPAIKSYEGAKVYSKIDSKTLEKINKICKENSITPYMLLLSVYYILLSKYTSQDDIVIGSPIVGRNLSDLYNIIGMFVNTLPVRAKIDSSLSFNEFLSHIKNICLENYKYQDYPLNSLISKLNISRDTSRSPLFDTLFTYQNNGLTNINFNGINSKLYIPDAKISKFDLSLEIVPENDILNLNFEYCTKLFTKQFIETFANHYKNILNTVLNNLDVQISSICMLSGNELNKIIYEFNNTKIDYPKDKTISQLFEEQVEKTPDNIALVFEDQKLTYKELNEKANSLAYLLRKNGIGRQDIVGIMVNRSLEMIISILAVLKAGGTYIPIDPEYPEDRINYMLNNSNAKILLTFEKLKDKVSFKNIVFVELSNKEIYCLNKNNLKNINKPEDSCYIIYTSGSTGLPKGVILKHKSLTNLQKHLSNSTKIFKDKNIQKTVISVTTVSFDIFIFETLICLNNGFKLIVCNEEEQNLPSKLYNLLEKEKIEIIQMTPSRMHIFLDNLENIKKLANIKTVVLAGEPLPYTLVNRLKNLGVKNIYNGYGPSETTVFSTFTNVTNLSKINIGKPLSNTQIYILDKNSSPCPINIPGELYISGDGVGKGYLNNKDLTEKSFIENPFIPNTLMYKTGDLCKLLSSGEIEYLERIDNQVKIRGLRIELGEIENKINEFPSIKKACVIKQSVNNRDFISAYFTVNKRVNTSELRKYLSNYLPRYMVPSYFTVLEEFPYTPNGKIDKKALPLPKEILSNSEEKYIKPTTELQIKLVNIFEDILNTKPIGINDNFFELGGDSILAMNLNIELKKLTDKISYADIFKFSTAKKLEDKINSLNENYDFEYMEKNYDKYTELLNKNLKVPRLHDLKYKKAGNILLTGGTGFLGIHILDSFIKKEKGNIYCIIRNETGLNSNIKLQQKLHYYFGNKYDNLIGKRIFAITGDITSPGFGLNQEELLNLANNIDIVINSAAKVSHFGNYSEFYNVNVKSVKYMLNFCKSFNKKFYQISTLSVSGNALETASIKQNIEKETIFNESNLYIGQNLENVYIRSKFEAECLVLDNIFEGLDAHILRIGNLMPRYKDGMFQENISENAYINRLLSFIKIGAIPESLKNSYLEFTPIDITANSIINLITHPNENNRIFHLFNNNHVYLKTISKHLKGLNKNFKILDDKDFKKKIKKILNNTNKKEILNSLINDFDKDLHLNYFTDIIIKSDTTIKYLQKINFRWPKISKKYLNNFINLLRMVL